MFQTSQSEAFDDREKWVDNLLATLQEPRDDEDHEDSRSDTSDIERANDDRIQQEDSLIAHLEDLQHESASNNQDTPRATLGLNAIQNDTGKHPGSKLRELQEQLKEGQEHLDSRYKNIEELFQRLSVTLNAAQQEERTENLESMDSLKSDVRFLKVHYQKMRTENLEIAGERYLENRNIRFQNGIPPHFGEADVLLDSQIVEGLRRNDKLRQPRAALGFHVIYGLRQSEYGQHLRYAPDEIIDIVNTRAELSHLGCYKTVVEKEKFSALKQKGYGIISLWMKHVDLIKEYPADVAEAEAIQLENYPAEKIEAEIAELDSRYQESIQVRTVELQHTVEVSAQER